MSIAILVMSYGTPSDVDEIAEYYTDIRRGRPPSEQEVAELRQRYEAIGGLSPLTERSLAQVHAIEKSLEALAPSEFSILYATKHAKPKIEEIVEFIAGKGIKRLIGLVLAPHYSPMSIGDYITRAGQAAVTCGIEATFITEWHELPALIELLSSRVRDGLSQLSDTTHLEVVFTAHSLPIVNGDMNETYVGQLHESAAAVAKEVGLDHFVIAWQSAGQRGGRATMPWLGPDISEELESLAGKGTRSVVICPQGFTSDHLEILYDIDIVATEKARCLGIELVRTASLNDDPQLADGLAQLLVAKARATWSRSDH